MSRSGVLASKLRVHLVFGVLFWLVIVSVLCRVDVAMVDAVAGPEKVCRGTRGECDVEERCTGDTPECPDGKLSLLLLLIMLTFICFFFR
jgi:hypothetical protein